MQEFKTGAVRDEAEDKPRFDLFCPYAMEAIGAVLKEGVKHYGAFNWAKGIPLSRCMESLERHIQQFKEGKVNEDHLAHAACNIMFMLSYIERHKKGVVMHLEGKDFTIGDEIMDLPIFKEASIDD